jgi:hypothetical protein
VEHFLTRTAFFTLARIHLHDLLLLLLLLRNAGQLWRYAALPISYCSSHIGTVISIREVTNMHASDAEPLLAPVTVQANYGAMQRCLSAIAAATPAGSSVVELYAGCGVIGLALAAQVETQFKFTACSGLGFCKGLQINGARTLLWVVSRGSVCCLRCRWAGACTPGCTSLGLCNVL